MLARPEKPSGTMALIDALVEKLPPYPLGAPLPDQRNGKYHDAPCSNPRTRYGWPGISNPCICGFEMGEHNTRKPDARQGR